MELLLKHRTIRKYTTKDIAVDDLNEILASGMRASNTGNMQLYSVVVTRNEEMKAKMAPMHFNQPMVKQAPVVLTVCLDVHRFNRWCEINKADAAYDNMLWFVNGIIDSMLFAQNICVAAENKGMGICYLGTALYNAAELINLLNLPQGVFPVTTITMGYPEEIPEQPDRLPMQAIVHEESYREYSDDQIREIFALKEALVSSQKFVAENGKENLAQVFTDIRYKRADSEFFSEKILKTMREQGFKI